MKISVIIPAYNAQRHIGRAIDSVLKQARPADEVIVIDDGSADRTADIVRSYGGRVMLIQQPNAGVSAARNAGIAAAAGDWIAFLDADDEWLPEKLRLQCELLERNPQLCWVGGNYYRCACLAEHAQSAQMDVQKQTDVQKQMAYPGIFEDYFTAYCCQAAGHADTMIVLKSALLKAGLFCESQAVLEDDDLWLRLAYMNLRYGFVLEPLAVYHLGSEQSLSKRYADSMVIDDYVARHLKFSEEAGKQPQFRRCACGMLSHRIHLLMTCGRGREVRLLVRKYGDLLAFSFRWSCLLGSLCPPLWNYKENLKNNTRGLLKKRKAQPFCNGGSTCRQNVKR
ncbi:MAG: glycosyltransferase [Planctomycetales bacterium]|nr:glycosyltransferase [Planctomycetales bacterium]